MDSCLKIVYFVYTTRLVQRKQIEDNLKLITLEKKISKTLHTLIYTLYTPHYTLLTTLHAT